MGRKAEVAWQVLQDDDEWSEDTTSLPVEAGSMARPRVGGTGQSGLRWLSLWLGALLLLAQAWWMAAQNNALPTAVAGDGASLAPAAMQRWEGDYFLITYLVADAGAAVDGARLLEARYAQLRRALGFAPVDENLKISLTVEGTGLAEQEAFVCHALDGLGEGMVSEILPPAGEAGSWQIAPGFVSGLRDWAEFQLCPALLAVHRRQVREQFASATGLLRLQDLRPGLYSYPYRGESPGQTARDGLAFVALIEYAIQTYGVGRLPLLLAGLQQSVTWESLIFSVFDVSIEEFEAGWRAWLAEEYGVTLE